MHENKNTNQGIRHHDKDHLPKTVLNKVQDPHSFENPLKKEQQKIADSERENKVKQQQVDENKQ